MNTKDKLICLKNLINDVLKKETANYYDIIAIRNQCMEVETEIDNIFDAIKIDLNV